MRVCVDAACWSNRRGFGRYTRELVSRMVALHPEHEFVLVVDGETADCWDLPAGARVRRVATSRPPTQAASADGSRSPADLLRMAAAATRDRPDVFFFPAVYSFFPVLFPAPFVVTFHDAIAEELPDKIFPGARSRLFWAAKCWLAMAGARRILTVSEDARRQIVAAFRCPADSVVVVAEGPASIFTPGPAPGPALRRRLGIPEDLPLLLYVGGISPHKNLDALLHALALLRGQPPAWHLVLAGDLNDDTFLGCHQQLVELAARLELSDRVTFPGFVSDADLVDLYRESTLLVLPSLSEGFGLPVVEAMACGLPVAASRRGSLAEVVGTAGTLFDPSDPRDVAAVVGDLLAQPGRRATLARAGLAHAGRMSWDASARSVVTLLADVVAGR